MERVGTAARHVLVRRIRQAMAAAEEQSFEDGIETAFSRTLSEVIRAHGPAALDVMEAIVAGESANPEVVSEMLRVAGRVAHAATTTQTLRLLERGLLSRSSRVRDAAVVGIAYLDDPEAIPALREAAERERVAELRTDMEQTLHDLGETARCLS